MNIAVLILGSALLACASACGGVPPAIRSRVATTTAPSTVTGTTTSSNGTTANTTTASTPVPSTTSSTTTTTTSNTSTTTTNTTSATPPPLLAHQVSLSWDPSPALVDGYMVYRSAQPGGPYSRITSATVFLTSYADVEVAAGQTYFYVVTATAAGVESAYSNEVVATIPSP